MPRRPTHTHRRPPITPKSLLIAATTLYLAAGSNILQMGVYAAVNPQVLNNVNITAASLGVRDSVSSPTCNATQPCITFVNDVVPRCLQLGNDPGCWCGNHDPLHYCSLCMSTPTDNTTTPDQTELAISSHRDYHIFCAAYANRTSNDNQDGGSGSGSSTNIGAIVGGVVGGVAVIALIALGVFLYHRKQKKQATTKGPLFEQQQMMMAGGASGMDTTAGTRTSFFSAFSSSKKPSPDNLAGGDFSPSTTGGPDRGTGFTPHPYMLHPNSPATNAPLHSPITASSTPPLNTASSGGGFAAQQQRPDLGYDTSMLRDLDGPRASGGYGQRPPYNG